MDAAVAAKIDAFFSQYRVKKYSKGQILILSGDDADYVYQILSGKIKMYDITYRGEEIILNIFKPPAFFPMSLALNKSSNLYTYEAETDVEMRQAPADEVVDFVKNNPDVMYDLLCRLYIGLDGVLGRMTRLMSGSARSRLLYELLLEIRRFGKKQDNGHYLLDLSEKDLGARAGLTRETVSREMRRLKDDNLIIIDSKGIIVKDIDALERKLGQAL